MKKTVKKTVISLLAIGLLVGTIVVMAIACAGGNGTNEVDDANGTDADTVFGVDDANVNNENDIAFEPDVVIENEEPHMDYDNTMVTMIPIPDYYSVTGIVESIEETGEAIQVIIEDEHGSPAVLILNEDTVYPFDEDFVVGDVITGWYVTDAPMIAIWPPQFNIAVLVAGAPEGSNIKVCRFTTWEYSPEDYLISQDEMFAFLVDEDTEIVLANGDDFTDGDIEGRRIVVIYDISTRSIPEMTTANKLIVLYEDIVPFR